MNVTTYGLDLAKRVFQVHLVEPETGEVKRRALARAEVAAFFARPQTPGDDMVPGRFYKPWLEFRAQVIRAFVGEIARAVRDIKTGLCLGTYVGSWYPNYYEVGVNWGKLTEGILLTRHMSGSTENLDKEVGMFKGILALIAEAPVLIVANAADAKRLVPDSRLSLSAVRGQLTYLPADPRRRLDIVVSGTGYVAPLAD